MKESGRAAGDWFELSIDQVDGEIAEAVAEAWRTRARTGVVVEERDPPDWIPGQTRATHPRRFCVRLFVEDDGRADERLRQAEEAAAWLRRIQEFPACRRRRVPAEDWAHAWRRRHGRLLIGNRLLLLPPWDDAERPAGRIAVVVEPGSAFGLGSHPSTRLALELLEEAVHAGDRLLDVGCGSGVLGIAALKLGAARVWACDIDPAAVRATAAEAERNGVGGSLEVVAGSAEDLPRDAADLVVMNIVAEVLIRLLPAACSRLRPGGKLLLSGILADREAEVRAAAPEISWTQRRMEGDWVALRGRSG